MCPVYQTHDYGKNIIQPGFKRVVNHTLKTSGTISSYTHCTSVYTHDSICMYIYILCLHSSIHEVC